MSQKLFYWWASQCVKSVHIRSFSSPYFPSLKLNTERYLVSLRIQFECGKKPTRKTTNWYAPVSSLFQQIHRVVGYDKKLLTTHKVSWLFNHVVTWGLVVWCEGGALWQVIITRRFKWHYDHVITWNHATNEKHDIFFFTKSMANKHDGLQKEVTNHKVIRLFNHMFSDKLKHCISTFTRLMATKTLEDSSSR